MIIRVPIGPGADRTGISTSTAGISRISQTFQSSILASYIDHPQRVCRFRLAKDGTVKWSPSVGWPMFSSLLVVYSEERACPSPGMGFHSQMVKLVNCGLRLSVDTKINLLREFWKLSCKLSHQSLPRAFEKRIPGGSWQICAVPLALGAVNP